MLCCVVPCCVQVALRLKFIPSEVQRVNSCVNLAQQLQDSVRERLTDVLLALVDSAMGLRAQQGTVSQQLRQMVQSLKQFVLGVGRSLDAVVFQRVNDCAREIV